MRSARFPLIFVLLLASLAGCARTSLRFSGSEYNLREIKRGLFLGICPNTSQIQWSYYIHLDGLGPDYSPQQVKLQEGGSGDRLNITSGQIHLDRAKRTMSINLSIAEKGVTSAFAHNGVFAVETAK